jgi:hypothetical protein
LSFVACVRNGIISEEINTIIYLCSAIIKERQKVFVNENVEANYNILSQKFTYEIVEIADSGVIDEDVDNTQV